VRREIKCVEMSGCWCCHEAFARSDRASVGRCEERLKDKPGGQILQSLLLMVGGAVVFREVVATIGRTGGLVISELLMVVMIAQPPVLHVHCFCALWQYDVGYNAKGGAVVHLNGRGGLFMPQFFKEHSARYCLACVDVKRAKFGFSSGGHDGFDILGGIQDSTIIPRIMLLLA
jgi:hypothetical protein